LASFSALEIVMRRTFLPLFVTSLLAACGGGEPGQAEPPPAASTPASVPEPQPGAGATVFTNASIWDGSGAAVMRDAWLLVRDGRVAATGSGTEVPAGAAIVDLNGAFVVPGFINAHGHVSGLWAADDVTNEVDRIRGSLAVYASYGVTTVLSLGDSPDTVVLEGTRAERDDPALNYARAYLAGDVIAGGSVADARQTAIGNVALKVDFMKIRIDDDLGTQAKIPWDAVQAAIDVARQNNIPVATHIFYMDDAAMAIGMGARLIAHSVRDQDVSDTFVQSLLSSGACYVPTLVREVSTFVYEKRPQFFDDPFFLKGAKKSEMVRVTEASYMTGVANSPAPDVYRKALIQAQDNLRILAGSGVPIAFGTDSGPAGRFPGYFEHMEFDLMAEAGLTPREILLSATSVAAKCLGLDDVGTLEAGSWADFVVLAEDPLADIKATRSLRDVYVAGNKVP
jgi:imidazolonepropionase-like amidohydrolase